MSIIVGLIVAAGRGMRAGGGVPKQYRPLAGRPVIVRAHDAMASHPAIDRVVVVVDDDSRDRARALLPDAVLVGGGENRRDSVRAGLAAVGAADLILIHDAARPLLPHAVVDRLIAALDAADGVAPVLSVADSLVDAAGAPVPRDGMMRVQTPQGFRLDAIRAAHDRWDEAREATDDLGVLRAAGGRIATVAGDPRLEKITREADFAALARLLPRRTAVGNGFDVHRLEADEELWLGGLLIPHDKGLSGHSDADVGLHALTDAVLGALGAGDIGSHFPPSDPQWRGARSGRFLEHARDLVAASGGRIEHVDLTLICEAPKIGPHRDAMAAEIARLLALPRARVSVKATTTERLGFAGRGEGIAAQATATLSLPADPTEDDR